jgi:IS30 family transposase
MAGRGRPRLPRRVEREFWRQIVAGLSTEDAAAAAGVSKTAGERWFAEGGGMPTLELSEPSGRYLSMAEREEIAVLRGHCGVGEIARRLGRAASTISRELRRNASGGDPSRYRATVAQAAADQRARRPKTSKIAAHQPLHDYVSGKLAGAQHWSPEQISARIRLDFPDDERMRISHEAIYQGIYVQGRGALRRDLATCLRTGRALRKPRRRVDARRERIKDKVMIVDRPAEVEDRAVPGHWEGDCATRGRTSGVNTPREVRW